MSFTEVLAQLSSYINHQSANLEDQINRLEQAKQEIRREKNNAVAEWNTNLTPNLQDYWEGNRAKSFDESRSRAHSEMQNIFHSEYDRYIEKIDSKLTILEMEKSGLTFAKGLTCEAECLLKRGEEATEDLQRKIKQIRRQ
ncbi:DUF5082 family protein [Bacillus sp. DNRA2]|uniref:YwqH-like family protein n=1 Tax=Bacillus sp. DNRA2 TaxID=2723053 RepID=UPI00145C8B57|nr:DUF5082 family protein [Bacillus sp. DNRA2]NMD72239.1 DUF5082 family protein [Bacillus sp. DNRA2]